jgi:hypothetical protein
MLSFSTCFLLMTLISLCAFSECAHCHSMHSTNRLHELKIKKKKTALEPRPGALNRTVSRKQRIGVILPG